MAYLAKMAARSVLFAGCAGSVGAGIMVSMDSDSGFARSLKFWSGVLPVYAHYKYVEKFDLDFEPLNDKYAPRMEKLALEMQGFYFKLAQVMSTRDEFFPDQYMTWMKRLQDRSPRVLPSNEAKAAVGKALGMNVDDVFEDWVDEPIGAASIGQVHKAKLRSTGEEVAVKLMLPGIEAKFRNDIDNVEMFCEWLMPQNAPYFSEIKKQFASEFDFVREAENLSEVSEMLSDSQWTDKVVVPRPIPELCTKTVLTMTYLPGDRLIDGVREHYRKLAADMGMDFKELEKIQKKKIQSGQFERKDISESARQNALVDWALWIRDLAINSVIFVGNWTIAPFYGEGWEYTHSERPINLAGIIETLLRVHAYEIFFGGAFNSDPHPGNILLIKDENSGTYDGRLGLIDYGQVKRMTLEDRIVYAKVILALHREDREEVVRLFTEEIGFRTKNMNHDVIWRAATFWNDRDTKDITQGKNVHQFMEWLEEVDPPVKVNDEFVLVARVSVLMRGMANAFGLRLRVTDYWHKDAADFLESLGIDY